ncbi:MAG: hypothetical protein R3C28_29320 [Pirellulaceae bacterium]
MVAAKTLADSLAKLSDWTTSTDILDPVVLDCGERACILWFYFHGMQVGDIDGDGDTDIVLYSTPNGSYRGTVTNGSKTMVLSFQCKPHCECHWQFLLSDVDDGDLDIQTSFYINWREHNAPNSMAKKCVPGDANGDGRFDSSDLVQIFQAGHYEDAVDRNSTKAEGDFNGDGDFTTLISLPSARKLSGCTVRNCDRIDSVPETPDVRPVWSSTRWLTTMTVLITQAFSILNTDTTAITRKVSAFVPKSHLVIGIEKPHLFGMGAEKVPTITSGFVVVVIW